MTVEAEVFTVWGSLKGVSENLSKLKFVRLFQGLDKFDGIIRFNVASRDEGRPSHLPTNLSTPSRPHSHSLSSSQFRPHHRCFQQPSPDLTLTLLPLRPSPQYHAPNRPPQRVRRF